MPSGQEERSRALGFALTLVEGRGVLSLDGQRLPSGGRIERLELEIPDLRFPFDLSRGIARFQRRRCRLREAVLALDEGELEELVRAAPLGDYGIDDVDLRLQGQAISLCGQARVGARAAPFSASIAVRPMARATAGEVWLRLSVVDLRLFGFLPLPAPCLASAFFAALGAVDGGGGRGPSLVSARGAGWVVDVEPWLSVAGLGELDVDALGIALAPLLVGGGWRLPCRKRLSLGRVRRERERLLWEVGPLRPGDDDKAHIESADGSPVDEERERCAPGEALLAGGALAEARAFYERAAAGPACASSFARKRLLQLLVASEAGLAEADARSSAWLADAPEEPTARLAQAIVRHERGDAAGAAALYERLAANAAAPLEEAAAAVAAAKAWERAGEPARATARLEAVMALRPRAPAIVVQALAGRLRQEKRWHDLLGLLRRRAVDEVDAVARGRLYAEAGLVFLDELDDPVRARDRFEQAVRVAPGSPEGWEGLARLHVAGDEARGRIEAREALARADAGYARRGELAARSRVAAARAALDRAQGAHDAALAGWREAAALDGKALAPPTAAAELCEALGRPDEAVAFWEDALARAEAPSDRARILRRLAALEAARQDALAVRLRLEQALEARPFDLEALDALVAVLDERGEHEEADEWVRRLALAAAAADEARGLAARLVERARKRGRDELLDEGLAAVAATADETAAAAALELAGRAERGDDAAVARAAAALEAVVATANGRGERPAPAVWLALGRLRVRQGDDHAAEGALRAALEGALGAADAVFAWSALVEIASRREDASAACAALLGWADDRRTAEEGPARANRLAEAARLCHERLSRPGEALALLERAQALDPADETLFERAASAAAEAGRWPLVAALVRGRLAAAPPEGELPLVRRLFGALVQAGAPAEVEAVANRLLALAPDDIEARLLLARRLWAAGNNQESARHFERLLAVTAAPPHGLHPGVRAEAHLRLGQWARVVGRAADANRHLDAALAEERRGGAPPIDVLVEALEAAGRTEDLLQALEGREERAAPTERRALAQARGATLERIGRSGEAVQLYERLLGEDAEDVEALQRLCEIHRREAHPEALVAPLRRLYSLAERAALDRMRANDASEAAAGRLDAEALGLELVSVLEEMGAAADAEGVLRRLAEPPAPSAEALDALVELAEARGAREEADALYARRLALEPEGPGRGALVMARARRLLATPGSEDDAFAWLRRLDPMTAPPEALLQRAQLAEALGHLEEAACTVGALVGRARAEGRESVRETAVERLGALAGAEGITPEDAASLWERALDAAPEEPAIIDAAFDACERLSDEAARDARVLRLAERLGTGAEAQRGRIHLAHARTAERTGDLARAEEEHRRALALYDPPSLRAEQLVGHARVLVALKEGDEAVADLDEAIALAPAHAGARALAAELAYRAQDWERARRHYDALAVLPGRERVISPGDLAFRRAELAEMFGAEAEAEAAYREVAAIDAEHVGAREALAQIALFRGDAAGAVGWLEELLGRYAPDASAKIIEARLQLGKLRAELGALDEARRDLELVLAEEPDRVAALEAAVGVYERLGLRGEAAEAYGRLARAADDPTQKAAALFAQGELLRRSADEGDAGGLDAAGEAYLRAFDLDPAHLPTLQRLVEHYFREGDLENTVEVGRELLLRHGAAALVPEERGLLVALAAAARVTPDLGLARTALGDARPAAGLLADRALELVRHVGPRALEAIERALRTLMDGASDDRGAALESCLLERLRARPWELEAALLLGRLAELRGRLGLAKRAYALALFADPTSPIGARYAELPALTAPSKSALAFGRQDHPACAGPLRAVLAGAAEALAGLPSWQSGAPAPPAVGLSLPPEVLALVAQLWETLGGPPVVAVGRPAGVAPAIEGTRPLQLAIGARPEGGMISADLVFALARAIELGRGAAFVLGPLGPLGLRALLLALAVASGVRAAEDVEPEALGELGGALVGALLAPDRAAALPGEPARGPWSAALREALQKEIAFEAFSFGIEATADRIGLLACRDPFVALAAVAAEQKGDEQDDATVPTSVVRQGQLRAGGRLHALATYLLSEVHVRLLGEA